MTSLQQLVRQNLNPFDPATFRPGNFWQERQNPTLEVDSIHQSVLQAIEQTLQQVATDQITRTILMAGDSGAGKSHLLGRLKRRLNHQAFFAYIGPWPESEFLWRHTLRNTVDSLLHVPEGQTESQLMLWLKSLPALRERSLTKWLAGERRTFIRDLRASFPVNIYNAREFFGILYDIATNPDLRMLACDWLKGDDLDEEDLKELRVKRSIDSENAAQKILSNIGRIAASTQPIVLCFDNLDNIPLLETGKPDLQSLFNLNTTIHNEKLSNFLVLISIITSTWKRCHADLQPADRARVNQKLHLGPISLDQAEALWATRLAPLHAQADEPPQSAIAPLSRHWLDQKFPGGKTLPRNVLMLGQQLISHFKTHRQLPVRPVPPPPPPRPPAPSKPSSTAGNTPADPTGQTLQSSFQLLWRKELQTVQQQVTRLAQFTSPDLIWRLRQALEALEVPQIQPQFLKGSKFAAYSFAYQASARTGVVWSEDRNMKTFYHVMNACQKQVAQGRCDRIYFIRAGSLGRKNTRGNQLYCQLFDQATAHAHIQPDLASVQILETYHRLVNAASGGELVVAQTTPHLKQLQALVREAKVLETCRLLQALSLVATTAPAAGKGESSAQSDTPQAARAYMVNLVTTQQLIGLEHLIKHTQEQFVDLEETQIEQLIDHLCQEQPFQLLDAGARRQDKLICLVPTSQNV